MRHLRALCRSLLPVWPESRGVRSDFLIAQPSALSGIARLFDVSGRFSRYNQSRTPAEADARALYSDWRVIGQDLCVAAEHVRREEHAR